MAIKLGSSGVTFSDGTVQNYSQVCKAWANMSGGSATVRASYNISSISRYLTGRYTVYFTNSLPDSNYCVTTGHELTTDTNQEMQIRNRTTSSFDVWNTSPGQGDYDSDYLAVIVFR